MTRIKIYEYIAVADAPPTTVSKALPMINERTKKLAQTTSYDCNQLLQRHNDLGRECTAKMLAQTTSGDYNQLLQKHNDQRREISMLLSIGRNTNGHFCLLANLSLLDLH